MSVRPDFMHTMSCSHCTALFAEGLKLHSVKNPRLFVLGLALASALSAAEQILVVSPSTLEGWSVTGADKATLARNPQLVLPAGSQLGQNFSGNAVILHLVSQPALSASSAEWPILAVGPAALAVVAENGGGRLMLVVNESTLIELPWKIPTTQNPASLDLLLAYDPLSGAGLIAFQNQTQAFEAGRSTGPVDVFLTAGASNAWPCEKMEVLLLGADPVDPNAAASARSGEAANKTAEKIRSAAEQLLAGHSAGAVATAATSLAPAAVPVSGANVTLEIFTPPCVRRTEIIAAVRSTVANAQRTQSSKP